MTPSLKRGRIEQKTKVLQLLTLSGAVRDANIEARYRGSETLLGVAPRPQPEMRAMKIPSGGWISPCSGRPSCQAIGERSRNIRTVSS